MEDLLKNAEKLQDLEISVGKRKPGESILDYTQRIRESTIEAMQADGPVTHRGDVLALSAVLDSMDRQEIEKKKLDLESGQAANDAMAYSLISSIINRVGNINPYESAVPVKREHEIDHDVTVVENIELVEGELDFSRKTMNYDSFMKEYKAKNPKNSDSDEDS